MTKNRLLVLLIYKFLRRERKNSIETSELKRYRSIDQEEAQDRMEEEDNYLIVDVRRPDEYEQGHIPNAVNLPLEFIGRTRPGSLPNLEQRIFIYCGGGNRSRQASEKLSEMGYTGIYEFGGINFWTGDIVKD
ncbi:MAG: rhodanese-like domain-containing protein [Lachnospiraceae bacterium]